MHLFFFLIKIVLQIPLDFETAKDILNHRITEWLRLERPLQGTWSNAPAEAGPPKDSCSRPCPGGFEICPRMEPPQMPWATCASAWLASQSGNFMCFSLCPLHLSLGTTERSLSWSSLHLHIFSYLYMLMRSSFELSLFWVKQLQ